MNAQSLPGSPSHPSATYPAAIGRGRYDLRERLGRGASGEIFRATDNRSGSEVAVKVLRSAEPEEIYGLKREFRALADVQHRNLVRLHELHIDGTQCFFSMDCVEGEQLLEYIERLPASSRVAGVVALLAQLVGAIRTVHSLGIVHRDLKPENILVERGDDDAPRLVLIDFGLLAPLVPDARDSAALATLTGTIAYMAPEQLRGGVMTEAADWYAVGALLFHCLFGAPPFSGSAAEVATAKFMGETPVIPRHPVLPSWLEELLRGMLVPDPGSRIGGEEIADVVESECGGQPVAGTMLPSRHAGWQARPGTVSVFVGRTEELEELRTAFDRSCAGELSLLRVRGPSGIGKSELLEQFLAAVERDSGAVVLRGRCHPSEAIPRKGLDQVVDDLSRYLQVEPAACRGLPAIEAAALCQLFPVLGRVEELAASAASAASADPQVIRQLGIDAFASLLVAIGSTRPLVLWVDDVQWSDGESAIVLGRYLDNAKARSLVLLSYRSEAEGVSVLLKDSIVSRASCIEVGPLPANAARSLVEEMWNRDGTESEVDMDAIVREAAGSPFFLAELVRSVRISRTGRDIPVAIPRIEDVVALRYEALSTASRSILDVIALAGSALREETSVSAAGGPEGWRSLSDLERACLVRSVDTPEGRRVQPYHDRIAEGVRARFDETRRDAVHRCLIVELEKEADVDHELLVFHCSAAREMRKAGLHAVDAARRASDTLAFDRAAELYRFALEHGPESETSRARVGLAEALANAGRGEDAALAFQEAAEHHPGRPANDPAAFDLQRRGAEQLLRCGRIDEGFARMREALAAFGERLPATSGEAMRSALWQRLRLLARGTEARPVARGLDPKSQARLDAMWATTVAVSMLDVGLAGSVQVRHLLDALDAGDPDRLALALALEASWRSCLGPRMRGGAAGALEEARRLAARNRHPYPQAWAWMAEGIVHWQSGRFADAVPCLDAATAGYRQECRGVFFEIALTTLYQFAALALSGQIARLSELVDVTDMDARRRRDRFAHHGCFLGEAVQARLAADEPELALADAATAIAEWPRHSFLMPHYQHLLATVQADLYAGDAASARKRLDAAWSSLTKTGYLWLECPSLTLRFLRARAALGVLAANSDAPERASLLRIASSEERRIRRSGLSLADGYAATIRAGLRHAAGDAAAARLEMFDALAGYRAAGMSMHAAACDWALARTARPDVASDDGSFATQWAGAQKWTNLDRLADSIVPLPRP